LQLTISNNLQSFSFAEGKALIQPLANTK